MLKLIKHEIRKQIFSKAIIAIILLACESVFAIGLLKGNQEIVMVSNVLLQLTISVGILYVIVETANIFDNDLRRKQGYMLFMTPNSGYHIVLAKFLSGAFFLTATFSFFAGVVSINNILYSNRFNITVEHPLEGIIMISDNPNFGFSEFLLLVVILLLFWAWVTSLASLSSSMTYGFLGFGKSGSILSILVFAILLILESILTGLIIGPIFVNKALQYNMQLTLSAIFLIVLIGINFFITGWLVEKKVSL